MGMSGTPLWTFGYIQNCSVTFQVHTELTKWFYFYIIKILWYFPYDATMFLPASWVWYGWYPLIQLIFNFPQHSPVVHLGLPVNLEWNIALLPEGHLNLDKCLSLSRTHKKYSLEVNGPWLLGFPPVILSHDERPKRFCHQYGGLHHNSALRRFQRHGRLLLLNL